jgi:Fe-S-cluster containining protein
MSGAASDPGLAGVVPFRFGCHRCGHCCTHGDGHVWLADGEAERLALRLGLAPEVFERRHVRTVPDPRTGVLRRALREDPPGSGRCALLEGANHCSVYTDRPEHCRTFPYWPSVLDDADGFERARRVCPGIEPVVPEAARERAFAALRALYAEVDRVVAASRAVCIVRGVCCRFEEAGHRLYATALEADYAAATVPRAPPPEAPGRCPYHVKGRCTAREGRPLGCRTFFCDAGPGQALERDHEHFLARIRAIEREFGFPPAYASFPEMLRARGIGTEDPAP